MWKLRNELSVPDKSTFLTPSHLIKLRCIGKGRGEITNRHLPGTYFYRLNTKRKPLDDKRVRMALALAVDRESIVRNIHYRTVKEAGNITPPGTGGYTYQGLPLKYDPDKARQLLSAAGFPGGQGFPKLSVLYNSSEQHRRMAEVIQQMWKKTRN